MIDPRVISLAAVLGIPLSSREDGFNWDGKTVACAIPVFDTSDVIHEIAHWLCSSPQRRALPNYGLGPSAECDDAPELLWEPIAQEEEEHASLLGVAFEAALGLDFFRTLEIHSWVYDDMAGPKFWRIIAQLNRRGLLVGHVPAVFATKIHIDS